LDPTCANKVQGITYTPPAAELPSHL
jgi:hypothetical protein